jgi:acetone carboxylase gamma subunit
VAGGLLRKPQLVEMSSVLKNHNVSQVYLLVVLDIMRFETAVVLTLFLKAIN